MSPLPFLRALLGQKRHASPAATGFIERRHAAYRCVGCNGWGETLIFMSNGRDYCLPCARTVSSLLGSLPAGRRHDDVKSMNEPALLIVSVANR